jgi:hypothetical protein
LIIFKMQAFRSTARVASHFQPTNLPRLVRGYATERTFEHLLVSVPKPGVGLSKLTPAWISLSILLYSARTLFQLKHSLTACSPAQPSQGPQCVIYTSHPRSKPSPARLPGCERHRCHRPHRVRESLRCRRGHQGDEGPHIQRRIWQ